jgi:hypothetical protein
VNVDANTVLILGGLVVTNIAAIVGFFVSLKVGQARLEVKVDRCERDLNNLGGMIRDLKTEGESK